MTKDEALAFDLALEALEELQPDDAYPYSLQSKAITAIKQALAAPVQEPVWCGHCNGSGRMVRDPDIGTDQECFVCDGAGVPAAPVQEPVNWSVYNSGAEVASGLTFSEAWDYLTPERLARQWCAVCVVDQSNMPATPPAAQRQWVGLTDEEVSQLIGGMPHGKMVRVVESKLKEKNT